MNADRRANAVAIISPDPLLAALVGAAVELIGYRAAFPHDAESGDAALRRIRPAFVLLEATHAWTADETLLGRALITGARLFVFGREADVEARAPAIARFGMGAIHFPRDVDALHTILTRRVSPRDLKAKSLEQ